MTKITISAILLSIFVSSNAFAQSWFAANAKIDVNTAYAQATVQNSYNRPIYCKGYVYGRTYSGFEGKSWMDTWVYPGQFAYINVYAQSPQIDPMTNGWANIKCRF